MSAPSFIGSSSKYGLFDWLRDCNRMGASGKRIIDAAKSRSAAVLAAQENDMAQDLGEVVEEGGGKESFREILRILIQENRERQNDGSNAVAPAAKRRPVARIPAER